MCNKNTHKKKYIEYWFGEGLPRVPACPGPALTTSVETVKEVNLRN